MFDLDAYLARIGYSGPRAPTMAVLRDLKRQHLATLPFENIDGFMRRPVALDLAALQNKLIAGRRGGYCFEQNLLFHAALLAFGFTVRPLLGRVRWMRPPEAPEGPRTHLVLQVELDGEDWLVDVGFGGYLLSAPMRMALDAPQDLPGMTARLVTKDGMRVQQVKLGDEWQDTYGFTFDVPEFSDFVLGSWYTSTFPNMVLTQNLLIERLMPERRSSLLNNRLRVRMADGTVTDRMLEDAADLAQVLEGEFGLEPPVDAAALWERVPKM